MSQVILNVWKEFDQFPMETLTKYWVAKHFPSKRQRTVKQMKMHYAIYNITGNCFDLTLWLLERFRANGVRAYAVGHDLQTEEAHVAVVAHDVAGVKYLCDLGDQWIKPLPLDQSYKGLRGFFPGAVIDSILGEDSVTIHYHRPNGKMSKQTYDLTEIDDETLWRAAEQSQLHLNEEPLLEIRIPGEEVTHWEFYAWESFTSSLQGKAYDEPLETIEQWAQRIHEKTNYPVDFLIEVLTMYKEKGGVQ